MKMFFVYILKCNDASYYVGHTDDIEKRMAEHASGQIKGYTSSRLPVSCVFVQAFATKDEAISSEFQIKGWSRKKKEALIKKDWELLAKLSKKRFKIS